MYRTVNNIEHVRRSVESVSSVITADCQSSEESANDDCHLLNRNSVDNCVAAMDARILSVLGLLVSEVSYFYTTYISRDVVAKLLRDEASPQTQNSLAILIPY